MPRERALRKASIKRGPRAPYQLTCSNCRVRKVKCDGTQPQCRICTAYGESCHYDKPPPMSQILAMAQKIADLEHALKDVSRTPGSPTGSRAGNLESEAGEAPVTTAAAITTATCTTSDGHDGWQDTSYYQSTSALEGPTGPEDDDLPPRLPPVPSMDSSQLAFWETAATQLSAVHLQLPLETVTHLLRMNWTWFHPNFMFIPRSLFLRDAAVGGRHFSPLLLAALCLHSTRLTNHSLSDNLLAQVRLLLVPELHRHPMSIPTIQALLLLSAREVGRGEMSQTWLYSGLAFRMAVDIGIFSRRNAATDDPEMLAVKDHLAWSCYLWDKAISLYLGRTPALPEPPKFDPPPLDDLLENEPWSPYLGNAREDHAYPTMSAHTPSCFANFCRLGPIITEILMTIYAKKTSTDALPFVQRTRQKLEEWRRNSPDHLKVEPGAVTYPPSHIFSQNVLYYAAIILLHRPFRGSSHCRSICRDAAHSVARLLRLMEESVGLTRVSYIMAYCVYTAATVAILDVGNGSEDMRANIDTYLRALRSARISCPGIQCSIDLIKKGLEGRAPSEPAKPISAANAQPPIGPGPGPLPAFPLDPYMDYTQLGMFSTDILPFGGLDPYALEWSSLSADSFGDIFSNT